MSYPNANDEEREYERMRLPFDEFAYRKIVDVCRQFMEGYAQLTEDNDNTEYLGNLLAVVTEFANGTDTLPERLKHPEERFDRGEISENNIHSRIALKYVMEVFNELIRQQMKFGREPDWAIRRHERLKQERGLYNE